MTRLRRGHLGDPSVQKTLNEEQRRLREWELADLEAVLKTKEGRRLYYRIIYDMAGLDDLVSNHRIVEGQTAALHSWFFDGRRFVGRTMVEEAREHCPALFRKMLDERMERWEADSQRAEKLIESATETSNDG